MSWAAIILTFALVDNVVLSRLLGLNPDRPVPGALSAAVVAGFLAVLMAAASVAAWALDSLLLVPLGFTLLRTPVFVLLVVAISAAMRTTVGRRFASLKGLPGEWMPRACLNCAALGVVLISTRAELGAAQCLVAGAAAGGGYFLVAVLMEAINERLDIEQVPVFLRGFPLRLITAGLMAYAFMAFDRGFLARLLGA